MVWSYSELAEAFYPREYEYRRLIETRVAIYGNLTGLDEYFEGQTRETLKSFIRDLCETEISTELIKQRIKNKIQIKPD